MVNQHQLGHTNMDLILYNCICLVQLCNNNLSLEVDDESECTELSDELIQRPQTQERYPKKGNYSGAIELHPKLQMH